MTTNSLKLLDPVQGLVDFVLDIKPYHTKIVEVLIEYVYNEFVDVTILDDLHTKIDLFYPKLPNTLLPLACDGGYSTRVFGDPSRHPILSPNPTIPFESYPAINPGDNTFIIPGNKLGDFKVGTKVFLLSTIEDYTNVHNIVGVNNGQLIVGSPNPADDNQPSFTVSGDQTAQFIIGYFFDVVGTTDNDRTYAVSSAPIYDALSDTTLIPVGQSVIGSVVYGQIGVEKTVVSNTGEFTISGVQYDAGSIDSWPDISTPHSYALGDDPHTIITVVEPLTLVPALTPTQIYVAFVVLAPIVIEGMLPYSNYVATYEPLPPSISQTPDEGVNQRDILNVVLSIDDGFGSPIPDSGKFTISGDFTNSNVFIGDDIRVLNSGNSGIYIITSITYDNILNETTFGVADLVVSNVIEGQLVVDIQANVFIVDGNWVSRFTQGTQFDIVGGTANAINYTVLRSDLVDGKTRIRVIGDILDGVESTNIPPLTGLIVEPTYGFSDDPLMCDYVPETVLHVVFDEHLKFSSGSLELSDDLVVYNLENSDTWGFELPINSILSVTTPLVPEQATAPVLAVDGDLWYDTTNQKFFRYNGSAWVNILTAWWVNLVDNNLHYRTKTKLIDTGWVLDSNKVPGYSDVITAVGETELLFTDTYTVTNVGGSTPTTYTLTNSVPNTDPTLISVTINNVPAGITLDSATEFTILHPAFEQDDIIEAKVFDRTRQETNAHVVPFNLIPHIAFHEYVTTDVVNNAYIIGGGNFMDRFIATNTFTAIHEGQNGGILGNWVADQFPIMEVDDLLGTITIVGDYTWLFTAGRSFNVSTSENNTNTFVVDASLFDGTYTTIAVASPPVFESPDSLTQQYFYNPGVVVYNIDEVSDTIIVLGNVVDVYIPGLEMLVSGSTTANNAVWVVNSVVYDSINDRTNINVVGNIPDPDSSALARLHTPIFQNYSRDLGVIVGAIYEPDANGLYLTNQIKTIVVPTTPIDATANGIAYEWKGPLRMDILETRSDTFITSVVDGLGVSDELLGIPDRYSILDTNDIENYFVVGYVDPVLGVPVDLTDRFSTRTIFDVVGSYGNSIPNGAETNDAKYVVFKSFFDDPALVTPPAGIPPSWVTGSGNTFIQIETDYNNIPPYNSFTVVSISNNGASPNSIVLAGNHETLFNNFADPIFRLDLPLISIDPLYNVITVNTVTYNSFTMETTLTFGEEVIDELFTGALGLIETAYSGDVFYDVNNATLPWIHGDILREGLRIDQTDSTIASASIEDDLMFGWGTVERWAIVAVDNIANFETIDLDGNPATPDVRLYRGLVSLDTDLTGIIELNDRVSIQGSQGNDDDYEVALMSYNIGLDDTELVLRNQPKTVRVNTIADSGGLDGSYFLISSDTDNYYVWFEVNNSGSDPAVAGKLGISVGIPASASASVIAVNLADALAAHIDFTAVSDVDVVTIHALFANDAQQYAYDWDTGFTVDNYTIPFTPLTQLGYLELAGIDVTSWFQYLVKEYNPGTSEILVTGNAIGDIQSGQQIRVIGSQYNDQTYTIGTPPTFDGINHTTVPVLEQLNYGTNEIVELPSSTTIKVLGNSYQFVTVADTVSVINSTGNDGVYSITGVTSDGLYSIFSVSPSLPNNVADGDVEFIERGGWVESLRYQGIHIFHEDLVGINIGETVDAAVLTEGGSIIGAWDYNMWDVGSFDESLGTVIHLYSNVFNP